MMLEATVVFDDTNFYSQGTHNSSKYFFIMSEILGINLTLTMKSQGLVGGSYVPRILSFYEIQNLETDIKSGKSQLPCKTVISSDIQSCSGHWCPTESTFPFFENVKWYLRNNNADDTCAKLNFGFNSPNVINVVWHFRNGDICLHCNEVEYVRKIHHQILKILSFSDSDVGKRIVYSLESSNELVEYQRAYPNFKFNTEKAPIEETICKMLTSDILISSGSSIIAVAAFFPRDHPIVIEEQRKNLHNENFKQAYIFSATEVIRMCNGEFTMPFMEVKSTILSVLQQKLASGIYSLNVSSIFSKTETISTFSKSDVECRLIKNLDNNLFYFIMYGFKLWIKDMITLNMLQFVEDEAISLNSSFLNTFPGKFKPITYFKYNTSTIFFKIMNR